MMRKPFEMEYSKPMELVDIKPIRDAEGKLTNHDKLVANWTLNKQRIKYNILRQKLLLETLKKIGIFDNPETPYDAIIEEAPCSALSMTRLRFSDQPSIRVPQIVQSDRWFLVSEDFYPQNPFRIWRGAQGKLIIHEGETKIIGNDIEFSSRAFKGLRMMDMPFDKRNALVVVQGCSIEHMVSLCDSEYDIVFGDVYSELDQDSYWNYDNLYNYLKDICKNRVNCAWGVEPEVKRHERYGDCLVKSLIYCRKNKIQKRY